MSGWRDYAAMDRDDLIERLRRAEDVCVYFGWTAAPPQSSRSDALVELWQRWANLPAVDLSREGNVELIGAEAALASARRATRAATLRRIRGAAS